MSHFTVLVRVPASTAFSGVEKKVEEILAPFSENIEPRPDFCDKTDEVLREYEMDTDERIRLADGTLHSPYDEQFKNPAYLKSFARAPFGSDNKTPEWLYPTGSEKVEIPIKELYASAAAFATGYHDYEVRDGRYGYYTNTNGHWDWYEIGGRWRGRIPYARSVRPIEYGSFSAPAFEIITTVEKTYDFSHLGLPRSDKKWQPETKSGFCDGVRLRYVDKEQCAHAQHGKSRQFYDEYIQYLEGHRDFPAFAGPRACMLDLGLMECLAYGEFKLRDGLSEKDVRPSWLREWRADHEKDTARRNELVAAGWKTDVWGANTHSPGRRCDMFAPTISLDDLRANFGFRWNPISTYAFVDVDGWRQPGKMGWFGTSRTTPDSEKSFYKTMEEWLASGDQDDWIVLVDCHT